MPCRALVGRDGGLLLVVGDQCRVAGRRRLVVGRVVVCGALVLQRGLAVLMVVEQRIREQVVRLRRRSVVGKGTQELAVPVRSLLIVSRLLRRLCLFVVIGGEVLQMQLEASRDYIFAKAGVERDLFKA